MLCLKMESQGAKKKKEKKAAGVLVYTAFLKGQADAENLQKNDEAIQIPQELGKCQLRSNIGEKQ